jgi:tetratricopeptide (TPR) repeat protein
MVRRQLRFGYTRLFGVLTVSALLSACAVPSLRSTAIPPLENQHQVDIEIIDFLAVSPPMKQFVGNFAHENMARGRKAWNLAYAALDPILFNFEYDSSLTLTATDTFRLRTGNCLSFSNMFVAMAREAGLNAWFQEVKLPREWSNVNQTFLVSMHVNAVVKDVSSEMTVDISGARRAEWVKIRRLSDAEAEAQYYNNHGANALVENDLATAFAYLVKALEIAPYTPYIWSNLGVVYNRNGQVEDAKIAYLNALEINPAEIVALNNLQEIYVEEGDLVQAK